MGNRPTVYITYSLIIQGSFLQRQLNMDTAEWFLHMPRLTSWQLAQRGLVAPVLCDCWQRWIANHIVDSYPVTKFDCPLMRLHWRCGWRCGQLAKKTRRRQHSPNEMNHSLHTDHGLCGSNHGCTNSSVGSNKERGTEISTSTAPKFFDRSFWNSNVRTRPGGHPARKIWLRSD